MNVMIDIESLGAREDGAVLSIGAVLFDTKGYGLHGPLLDGEFYRAVRLGEEMAAGGTVDASTIEWWLKQPSEVVDALFEREKLSRAKVAASDLMLWLMRCRSLDVANFRIWAKPPGYDLAHLKCFLQRHGCEIPWHRREERDLRTLIDVAEMSELEPIRLGVEHNALDDAKHQARWALACINKLEGCFHRLESLEE